MLSGTPPREKTLREGVGLDREGQENHAYTQKAYGENMIDWKP